MAHRLDPTKKTRVLIDNSIQTNRSRMHWVKRPIPHPEGGFLPTKLMGAERVRPFPDKELEAEAEAILTVGNLIYGKKIDAFASMELAWEAARGFLGSKPLDPFERCEIHNAPNPIERGKFVQTYLEEFIKKGGKKDRKKGTVSAAQIPFFKWLCSLEPISIEKIIARSMQRGLTDFEIDSFRDIEWFKNLSQRLSSDENLPDAFHLWTVRRNQFDVFLTLDERLINQVASIAKAKSAFSLGFKVQTPIQFLKDEGIEKPDPYPCEIGRFYTFAELARFDLMRVREIS
jgi:hypothetical protein